MLNYVKNVLKHKKSYKIIFKTQRKINTGRHKKKVNYKLQIIRFILCMF